MTDQRLRYGIFIGDASCSQQIAVKGDPAEAIETARAQLLYHFDTATDACVLEAASKDDTHLLFWCRIENGQLHDLYRIAPRAQPSLPRSSRRSKRGH